MKKFIIPVIALGLIISASSCRKCYLCSRDVPIIVNGDTVNTNTDEAEVCGKSDRQEFEDRSYRCTEL